MATQQKSANELLELIDPKQPDDLRRWAMSRLVNDHPEACREHLGDWLKSEDDERRLHAFSLIGKLKAEEFTEQLEDFYEVAATESEISVASSALRNLDLQRYFDLLANRAHDGMAVTPHELALLASGAVKTPRYEYLDFLYEHQERFYKTQQVNLRDLTTVLTLLVTYGDYLPLEKTLDHFWDNAVHPRQDPRLSEAFPAFLEPFHAQRIFSQCPPTPHVFEDLKGQLIDPIRARVGGLDQLWTEENVATLTALAKDRNVVEFMENALDLAEELLERKGIDPDAYPTEWEDDETEPELAPLPVRIYRYLDIVHEQLEMFPLSKLSKTYQGFLILQCVHLLTVAEAGLHGAPPEEQRAVKSLRERLEIASDPLMPRSEAIKAVKSPVLPKVNEKDLEQLLDFIKHTSRDLVSLAIEALLDMEELHTEEAFTFLWNNLERIKSNESLDRLAGALQRFDDSIFTWIEGEMSRLPDVNAAMMAALCEKGSPRARDFAIQHADIIYRVNRWTLLRLADAHLDPAFYDILERYVSEDEVEILQTLVRISEANDLDADQRGEYQLQVNDYREREMRALTPNAGQSEEEVALTFECVCTSCRHAYNYRLKEVFLDRDFLEGKAQASPIFDPFFIRQELSCRNCNTKKMVLGPQGRQTLQRLLPMLNQQGVEQTALPQILKVYQAPVINDQKHDPRHAVNVLKQRLKQEKGNLQVTFSLVDLYDFLHHPEQSVEVLKHTFDVYPKDFRFPGGIALHLAKLERYEEALGFQKQAVSLFHTNAHPPQKADAKKTKQFEEDARRVYLDLRDIASKLEKQDEADEVIKAHPISKFFPGHDRNGTCPCGSGKKFKRCCLAAAKR